MLMFIPLCSTGSTLSYGWFALVPCLVVVVVLLSLHRRHVVQKRWDASSARAYVHSNAHARPRISRPASRSLGASPQSHRHLPRGILDLSVSVFVCRFPFYGIFMSNKRHNGSGTYRPLAPPVLHVRQHARDWLWPLTPRQDRPPPFKPPPPPVKYSSLKPQRTPTNSSWSWEGQPNAQRWLVVFNVFSSVFRVP